MFERLCPQYMAMGLSYEDFWDGDCYKAKYVREAFEIQSEQQSFHAWLAGEYIYEAIISASPVLNALSKKKTPFPYLDKPHAVTSRAARIRRREENEKKLRDSQNAFEQWMMAFNKSRKKGDGE